MVSFFDSEGSSEWRSNNLNCIWLVRGIYTGFLLDFLLDPP